MAFFTEWITRIVLFLLLAMVTESLLPSGMMRKYARLVMSILLLFIFLGPLLDILNIDPEEMMNTAQYRMDQQVNEIALQESIEQKKKEILEGQDAYKLEQVTEGLKTELAAPLKEQHDVQIAALHLNFLEGSMKVEALDKLILTLSPTSAEGSIKEVDISLSEQGEPQETGDGEIIQGWVAKFLDMDKEKIEIRWEEEDE